MKWTEELLQKEALKYKNRRAFQDGNPAAYKAARMRYSLDTICSHMVKDKRIGQKPVNFKWTEELLQKEALKYETKKEFCENQSGAYTIAKKKKILNEICSHMKITRRKWTQEELREEALKYKTKKEFMKGSPSAYMAACRMGIIKIIDSHMVSNIKKWNEKSIIEIASKYSDRKEFRIQNRNAYCAAQRRKLLDRIFKHMKRSSSVSSDEEMLFKIIKEKFPKTQKARFNKIRINNKPFIKTLEIDIYIPELRKGIEFDGDYWHSFDGLKRSHPTWPTEDIQNYHQIKDEYFKSKGIDILHINEKDWLNNQEECIKKCFIFLETNNEF